MAKDKEAELEKYLEKKKRQQLRDELMAQISELSKDRSKSGVALIKKKVKRRKEETFEKKLFAEDDPSEPTDADVTSGTDVADAATINEADVGAPADQGVSVLEAATVVKPDADLEAVKQRILDLNEHFDTHKLTRKEAVEAQRKALGIFYEQAEIASSVRHHLVTFIQGETGSGKTTQIPQFLYENGLTFDKMIGMTQPRRLSAISISARINYEANEDISGYKIKYESNVKAHTKIKVLTEGVLFREIQADLLLSAYSVIILDEVHERTTNMDILVGLLSRIARIRLDRGQPLRLVLMSATTDPEHFRPVLGGFNLIRLTGRVHPVSVFYETKTPEDYVECAYGKILAILQAEGISAGKKKTQVDVPVAVENDYKASILVFLTGKDEIYALKERLEEAKMQLEVLPLHAGLSKADQARVYEKYPVRKVILATNVAETSITVSDVVFVIDCGLEKRKITHGSTVVYRSTFISKSSAKQRSGRAGRTGPGVCYRLYSGDTFELFPDHRQPQVLTEPLDAVVLQLKNLGIKNVFGFPFIDPPSQESVEDAMAALEALGALSKDWNITKLGRSICRYPIKPRYARFLTASRDLDVGLFSKHIAITSILSSGLELKKHAGTTDYFLGAKSDLIVLLRIFLGYLNTKNKRRYSEAVSIPVDKFEEIRKMSEYLLRISGVDVGIGLSMTQEDEEVICSQIYYMFADQLAINTGASYMFNEDEVWVSRDSVDAGGEYLIFDYIVCGLKRLYVKNVTVVPAAIFKPRMQT